MTVPIGAPDAADTRPGSEPDGAPVPPGHAPHVASLTAPEATAATCPYLISVGGAWRQATPSREHRCSALEPPAPQPSDKQRRHCLSPHHVECAIFKTARTARAVGLSPSGDPAAVAIVDAARRPIARTAPILLERPRLVDRAVRLSFDRGPGQLALVALMILAFSVVAITRLSSASPPGAGGSASPSTIARASSSPKPTPRPTPRPSPQPSASAAPTPGPSFRSLYTVKKGDTLLSIAQRFKVHTGEIRRLNGLKSTYVAKPGDVLKIP